MKTHWITLIALLLFGLSAPVVWADELGDLADDSDNETTQEVSAELSDSDDLSADLDQDVDDMLDGEADEEEADMLGGGDKGSQESDILKAKQRNSLLED